MFVVEFLFVELDGSLHPSTEITNNPVDGKILFSGTFDECLGFWSNL